MDFIFGTLATDDLKLIHHRVEHSGLQHGHDIAPRDPQPGQSVTLTVTVGTDYDPEDIACYYTTDGSEPNGGRGIAHTGKVIFFEQISSRWDTLSWGYLEIWHATIPAQADNTTVRYRIGAWRDGEAEVFADWPDGKRITDVAAGNFFKGKPLLEDGHMSDTTGRTFTFHVDTLRPPAWAYDAIIYHIFVDRFYAGDGKDWLQTDDLLGFCGGTLDGIRQKLSYVSELGTNCIWLSPVHPSPTHHGYDATDYLHVEERLGGDKALRTLIDAAHARGIRVLLDLALNHLSNLHPHFQDAYADENSLYRNWFTFNDSPLGYHAFFNVKTMPQINVANPAARDWLIDVARHWLTEYEVDGFRLDHANGPGPSFWADFNAACKDINPNCYNFGEVIEPPDNQRCYAGCLDGNLDFQTSEALRKTFGYGEWSETQFERFVARHQAYFPDNFLMPTFLDNHDMDRFLFIANGDTTALKRAAAAQMRLPAPPVIYYGTEVGLKQRRSVREGGLEASRDPMLWGGDQDGGLLNFYHDLILQRTGEQQSR